MLTTAGVDHQALMVIAFNHKGVSADALFDIMRTMMVEIMKRKDDKTRSEDRETVIGVLRNLSNRYKTALQTRNDLLHGTWWIGFDKLDDTDYEKIVMHKIKATADGMKVDQPVKRIKDINNEIAICREIEDIIRRLWGAFIFRDKISVAKQFEKDGDRWKIASRRKQ